LKKSWWLLRPINVPFKNKWLRDTFLLQQKSSNLEFNICPIEFAICRILKETGLDQIKLLNQITWSLKCKLENQKITLDEVNN